MTAAVSAALALGARALIAPSAGNAAGALAAYGAAAKLPVMVAMPEDTPRAFIEECRLYGATVQLVPGTIADAGQWLRENGPRDAVDVSTLKEPYRIEGKKTMAYELYEQLDGQLPDVIVYPTGGGTGLVGMWKAFGEMRALGWPMECTAPAHGVGPGRRLRTSRSWLRIGRGSDGALGQCDHAGVGAARAVADRRVPLPARDTRDGRNGVRRVRIRDRAGRSPRRRLDRCRCLPRSGRSMGGARGIAVSRLDPSVRPRGPVQYGNGTEVPIISPEPLTDARRRSGGRSGP